jgi:hypothetical protein
MSRPDVFPISVLVERRGGQRGRWPVNEWRVVGVVAGGDSAGSGQGQRTPVRVEGDCEQVLWSGLRLELHKDSAESYWYNLTAEAPSVFVACRCDDEARAELRPFLVLVDADEAGAYLEGDDSVFSVPMPPEIHQWLERYVVENYVPQAKKKRKRVDWAGEHGRPAGDRGPERGSS